MDDTAAEVRWIGAEGARHASIDPLADESPSGMIVDTLCGRRLAKDIGLRARLWADCPQCARAVPPGTAF